MAATIREPAMQRVGPFWRKRATTTATSEEWGWCLVWLDEQGRTVAVEWLR